MLGIPRISQPLPDIRPCKDPPAVTTPNNDTRQTDTEPRRTRFKTATTKAQHDATPLTAAAITRTAGADRTFLYHHRNLLHTAAHKPTPDPTGGPAVTPASLQTDLTNTKAHSARLTTLVHQLQKHLSQTLSEAAWAKSRLAAPANINQLHQQIQSLKQHVTELQQQLEELNEELTTDPTAQPHTE